MFVSIYSASLGKRISEQYRVCMDQKGVPKDQAKLLKTYSIFTNLETRDIQQELYLMIEIVRFGPFEIREAGLVPSSLPIQGGGTVPRGKNKPQNMRRLQVMIQFLFMRVMTFLQLDIRSLMCFCNKKPPHLLSNLNNSHS